MKFGAAFAILALLLVGASDAFVLRNEPVVIVSTGNVSAERLSECYHKYHPQLAEYLADEQVTTKKMTECFTTPFEILACVDKYVAILTKITEHIAVINQKFGDCLIDGTQSVTDIPRTTVPPTIPQYKSSVSTSKPTRTSTTPWYHSTTTPRRNPTVTTSQPSKSITTTETWPTTTPRRSPTVTTSQPSKSITTTETWPTTTPRRNPTVTTSRS